MKTFILILTLIFVLAFGSFVAAGDFVGVRGRRTDAAFARALARERAIERALLARAIARERALRSLPHSRGFGPRVPRGR